MRQVLTSDRGGYYTTTRTADQFGRAGDFITSPEISQIFGELCGIWFMTEWMGQGRKSSGVQLIEMGPGRGTLMGDMLRTIAQFKTFAKSIDAVWMIEAGEGLRMKQKDLLCGKDAELKKMHDGSGWECISKTEIPVRWVEDIALLPKTEPGKTTPFIMAHEFFDALPIHAFESVAASPNAEQPTPDRNNPDQAQAARKSSTSSTPQWRELLVSPTPLTPSFLYTPAELARSTPKTVPPDFQLTLAKASTPTSLILPSPPRYSALKSTPGSRIEISPESTRYIRDLTHRITPSSGGAALIIDYGPLDTIPLNSLRGIRGHEIVSPFSNPGEADVSADVDFTALAHAAVEASADVEVYGPVEQGAWLRVLGIEERARQLRGKMEEGKKAEFEAGWRRLVEAGPRGMGKAYKVMGIVPASGGRRRPVGFGGDVEGL
jgi:NADH dehydrogenase [ubiquinone] 1 alpha subcomplex assembly factor 7